MRGTHPRPSEEHVRRARELLRIMLPALREVARKHGYAVTIHGTVARDIDLVVVPWRDLAVSEESVIKALFEAIRAVTGVWPSDKPLGDPEKKPYGRLAWSIRPGPEGPYFDISLFPREHVEPKKEEAPATSPRPAESSRASNRRRRRVGA